jgi:hypothetical protein
MLAASCRWWTFDLNLVPTPISLSNSYLRLKLTCLGIIDAKSTRVLGLNDPITYPRTLFDSPWKSQPQISSRRVS